MVIALVTHSAPLTATNHYRRALSFILLQRYPPLSLNTQQLTVTNHYRRTFWLTIFWDATVITTQHRNHLPIPVIANAPRHLCLRSFRRAGCQSEKPLAATNHFTRVPAFSFCRWPLASSPKSTPIHRNQSFRTNHFRYIISAPKSLVLKPTSHLLLPINSGASQLWYPSNLHRLCCGSCKRLTLVNLSRRKFSLILFQLPSRWSSKAQSINRRPSFRRHLFVLISHYSWKRSWSSQFLPSYIGRHATLPYLSLWQFPQTLLTSLWSATATGTFQRWDFVFVESLEASLRFNLYQPTGKSGY